MAEATFHRPARDHPPHVPKEPVRIAPPPALPPPPHHSLLQTLFPVVGSVSLLGFALVYHNRTFLYIALGMVVLMVGFSIAMRSAQARSVRKKAGEDARRYSKYVRQQDRALATAGDRQRDALARLYPDPGALWGQVVKRRHLWERRPSDPDFLHVRLGRGTVALDQPVELDLGHDPLTEHHPDALHEARRLLDRRAKLRNQPVVTALDEIGTLALTGERDRARAWTRALISQLAAFRAPVDLRVLTCFEPHGAEQWEWGKWLPHQRGDRNAPVDPDGPPVVSLLMARSPDELATLLDAEVQPRMEQLRRVHESGLGQQEARLVAPQLIVVLDGFEPGHPAAALPLFRELLSRARELRTLLVLLVDERDQEPSDIDARLVVPPRGPFSFEHAGPDALRVPEIWPDELDVGLAESLARALTPLRLEDRGQGDRSLAENVRLLDLIGLPSASGFDAATSQRPRPRRDELRVPLGIQADGSPLELDLKQAAEDGMGPHGLLIGATGSGKSELLRTLVTGLAMRHDPESLSFVLVDYKGGAAFAELSRLPHTAGLITNLQRDLSLVDRMRDALIGEQERRQTMLREAGNLDDCRAYRSRREADPSLAPMPYLLVIVDEFSELLAARPEFIDLFVGLGRVGRSLGIHLLFSSQRLEEGRLRGLESHLRYRICLRTYSATESKIVLGTPDAYLLAPLPGLGYLKVDTSVYAQFKAALVSTPHREPRLDAGPTVGVLAFDASGVAAPVGETADGEPAPAREPTAVVTDLEVLVDRMAEQPGGAASVHQVWVPPLPEVQTLDCVLDSPAWWSPDVRRAHRDQHRPAAALRVPIGTLDLPSEQHTEPLVLDFSSTSGHLAVVGAPQSGKSTLLRTLLASFVWTQRPDEAQFYCLDLGGGLLRALSAAPHVGGVVGKLDREAVRRTVRQMQAEIEERELYFRLHAIESMADLRARRARGELEGATRADVFLVIDGWASLRRDFEELDKEIEDIAAVGLNYGVHVVISANRWAEIRPNLLDNLGSRLELRLNDPIDSVVSRSAAAALPADVSGRGLTTAGLYFQTALPRVDGKAELDGVPAALGELVGEAAAQWDGAGAEAVRVLPLQLEREQLPPPRAGELGIPFGVEELRLEPVVLDLVHDEPHFVIYGDAEAGKTSLLRLLTEGVTARQRPDDAQLVLVDVRRSLIDVAESAHVFAYGATPPMVDDAVQRLRETLIERMPAPGASRTELLQGTGWSGPHFYLLVDDFDLVAGPNGNPLMPLLDLLAHGRDIGLHVVLARRVGGTSRGAYEPFFQRLRELGPPALLMSGDPGEGPIVGAQRATPLPPGRGYLIRRNARTALVQTAHAPARAVAPDAPSPRTSSPPVAPAVHPGQDPGPDPDPRSSSTS